MIRRLPAAFIQWFLLFILGITSVRSLAQLPTCNTSSTGYIYYHSGSAIWMYNPLAPISATNPQMNTISLPAGAGGFAVSPNINGPGPSPTFYTTVGGLYYYYNGTTWVNTGHSTGNAAAVNLGEGGGYIYNLVGATGQVYRYDGTGNGTLLTTVTGFNGGGPYDLQGSCDGNWYILNTTTPQWMRMYNSSGNFVQQWTLSGAPSSPAGGGFGIVGNTAVYNNGSGLLIGTISATNVAFTTVLAGGLTPSPSDFASCELCNSNIVLANLDTAYYCGSGPGIPLNVASGFGPFTWSVISGNAVITPGPGNSITVTSSGGTSKIMLVGAGIINNPSSIVVADTDTVVLIVPTAVVDAGPNDTIRGCATYIDTLSGSLTGTTPGITYSVAWTPAAAITSGGNTLTPIVQPTANTTYFLTASTPANKGGCSWTDSVKRWVKDVSVKADFNYNINWGCKVDSVVYTNTSTGNPLIYIWDFFDGSFSTAQNPTHGYTSQANQSTKLIISNFTCKDSVTKQIDTRHPLDASFDVSDDSACQQQTITFTNTSVTTVKNGINPSYYWDFGDGGTSTQQSPTYTYTRSGIYTARLIVQDFVPCFDTAYHTIVIDSIPYVSFTTSETEICEGQGAVFTGDYLMIGNTGITWDFGDGTIVQNQNPVNHAYDTSGVYTVKLTSHYRLCPDTPFKQDVTVHPFPGINLGPDTVMCPNGKPVALTDAINSANPAATYLWNTGATTPYILANGPGVYWARVTVGGCSASDSVTVNKDCYLDVPNSFTPNGDGLNDYFLPRQLLSRSLNSFRMQIFNRWGEIIFETSRLDGRGWDGTFNDKAQPQGVYIYLIDATFENGVKEHYTGNVTLLR